MLDKKNISESCAKDCWKEGISCAEEGISCVKSAQATKTEATFNQIKIHSAPFDENLSDFSRFSLATVKPMEICRISFPKFHEFPDSMKYFMISIYNCVLRRNPILLKCSGDMLWRCESLLSSPLSCTRLPRRVRDKSERTRSPPRVRRTGHSGLQRHGVHLFGRNHCGLSLLSSRIASGTTAAKC